MYSVAALYSCRHKKYERNFYEGNMILLFMLLTEAILAHIDGDNFSGVNSWVAEKKKIM